jgi:hypothetical protein
MLCTYVRKSNRHNWEMYSRQSNMTRAITLSGKFWEENTKYTGQPWQSILVKVDWDGGDIGEISTLPKNHVFKDIIWSSDQMISYIGRRNDG